MATETYYVSISDIVKLLQNHYYTAINLPRLAYNLGTSKSEISRLNSSYNQQSISSIDYLRNAIHAWVDRDGDQATVGKLKDVLTLSGLKEAADMISYYSDTRITSCKPIQQRLKISELLDKVLPKDNPDNADMRCLFEMLIIKQGMQNDETSISNDAVSLPFPATTQAGAKNLNVPLILKGISKCMERGVKEYIRQGSYGCTFQELLDSLVNQGSAHIAQYIEDCVNCVEADDKQATLEARPLLPDTSVGYTIDERPSVIQPGSNRFRPIRGTLYSKYVNLLITYPLVPLAFFFIAFLSGLGMGCTIIMLFMEACNNLNTSKQISTEFESSLSASIVLASITPPIIETTMSARLEIFTQETCVPDASPVDYSLMKYGQQLMPDWSLDVVSFCEFSNILLILKAENMANLSAIPITKCPERVTAIEIFGPLEWNFLQVLLQKLCRVAKLSFVGQDACTSGGIGVSTSFAAYPITHIHFQNFTGCANLYLDISSYIKSDNLKHISFKCVQFEQENTKELQNLIHSFPSLATIDCINSDNCAAFRARIPKHAKLRSKYEKC